MGITEAVAALPIPLIGGEAIAHQRAAELRKDAYVVHRSLAAPLVISVVRQGFSSGDVNVAAVSSDAQPRFINADERGVAQRRFYPQFGVEQLARREACRTLNGCRSDSTAEEVTHGLGSAIDGQ